MLNRFVYKLRVLYELLFFDTVVQGYTWRYVAVRFEMFIRNLLGFGPRPRAPERFVIKNSLAFFQVDASNDSLGKASPYFEWQLHSWIPISNTTFVDIGANIGFYSLLALNKKGYAKSIAFERSRRSRRMSASTISNPG